MFNTCEHQLLPMIQGPPLRLMVDPDAAPVAHHTPVPVPVHWQEEVKAGLDRDVRLGVIEPVPVGDPVTYCHRMVICAKKDGKPRRTVDMQSLNANATRETHHTQSPFHQARQVPAGMKKTVFDAWNGYHSVALHPDDRHLTTFITSSQKYLRAIRSFPTPQNITDIRSWFGLINQVAYIFIMIERMSPFHSLLKPDKRFNGMTLCKNCSRSRRL